MNAINAIQKAVRNPNKAFDVLRYRSLKIVRPRSFKRFIVLSRSRTGSNLLISFLNTHPNIWCQGEIFRRLDGRNYQDILNAAFSKQPHFCKAAGFKIFYYHPQDDETRYIWSDLESMQNLYVIHMKRRNILRTLISRKIAGIQDVWITHDSSKPEATKRKAVDFSVNELHDGFRQTRMWEDNGDRRFVNHPLVSIYYEDLVRDREKEFRKALDFLNLQYVQPKTTLKKQNPEKIPELLTNYEELRNAFDGTEWQPFFEEIDL